MTTQSLRGMANHGPMHWRGDRTGGNDAPSAQPDSGTFDEDAAFKKFNVGLRRPARAQRRRSPTRDAGVHRLHPAGDLSAEPDPAPRQLADRRPAGGPRLLLRRRRRTDPVGHVPQLRRLPRARSRRQRRVGVAKPGFFGTDGRVLVRARDRSSSRSRTCATCIRRSACSGWHRPLIRRAASRSCSCRRRTTTLVPGRSGARLRLPARRQHRHGVPLPFEHGVRGAPRPTCSPIRAGFPSPAPPTIRPRRSRRCWPTSSSGARSRRSCSRSIRTWLPSSVSRRRWPPGRATTCRRGSTLFEARAAAGECNLVVHGQARGRAVGFLLRPGDGALHPRSRAQATAGRRRSPRARPRRRPDLHGGPARQRPPDRDRSGSRRRPRRRRGLGSPRAGLVDDEVFAPAPPSGRQRAGAAARARCIAPEARLQCRQLAAFCRFTQGGR